MLLLYFLSLIDNLPCATKFQNVETHETFYEHGYRLGIFTKEPESIYVNNHLIMRLYYHKESEYEYLFTTNNTKDIFDCVFLLFKENYIV